MNLKVSLINILPIAFVVFVAACTNPFAPKLDDGNTSTESLLSDRTNIEGVFKNLQYAYTFKDTLIYGELLNDEFVFTYRDYDQQVDVSWGRTEEMKVTHGLFQNTERLDLVWNNIILINEDSTNIIRSFNLTITFNPSDIRFVDGRVNMNLKKTNSKWQIVTWVDESNF